MWGGGRRHAAQQQSTAATVHSGAITIFPSGWITIVDVVTLPDRNQLNTITVQRRHLRHIEAVAALIFSKAIVSFSLVLEAKVWIGKNKNNNKSFSRQPVSFCGKSCNFFFLLGLNWWILFSFLFSFIVWPFEHAMDSIFGHLVTNSMLCWFTAIELQCKKKSQK